MVPTATSLQVLSMTGRQGHREGWAISTCLAGCLLAGVTAAVGQAVLALILVAVMVGGLVVIGDRRRIVLLLWGAAALTAPLNGVRASSLLTISDVTLAAALLASVPDLFRGSRRRTVPPALTIAFGIVIGAGLLGTFFAQDVGASLANMAKVVLAAAGTVLAMAMWDPGSRRLRQFAWLWLAGASVSAMVALLHPQAVVGRALGLTTHPNHLGLVCVLAVGLGMGLASSATGSARLAAYGAVGLLMAGVVLSGSRGALLGLAVTILVAALLTRRARPLVVTGVALLLSAMALVAGVIHLPESNALSRLGGGGGAALSDAGRQQLFSDAIESINRHPFTGEGFEFAQAAHSIYLQALVVGGPAALAGFLWICWTITGVGLRGSRAHDADGNGHLVAGLTAGFAGYLCSNIFDNILWDRYLWTYLGLLIVLAGTLRHAAIASSPAAPRPSTVSYAGSKIS